MTWLLRELREDPLVTCGNCGGDVRKSLAEFCWYCSGPLCGDCWETTGHCGHPEAYQKDRELVRRLVEEQK